MAAASIVPSIELTTRLTKASRCAASRSNGPSTSTPMASSSGCCLHAQSAWNPAAAAGCTRPVGADITPFGFRQLADASPTTTPSSVLPVEYGCASFPRRPVNNCLCGPHWPSRISQEGLMDQSPLSPDGKYWRDGMSSANKTPQFAPSKFPTQRGQHHLLVND